MKELLIFIALVVLLIGLCCYGGYWYGSARERSLLSKYFAEAIDKTYSDGWNDGTANAELRCKVRQDIAL